MYLFISAKCEKLVKSVLLVGVYCERLLVMFQYAAKKDLKVETHNNQNL